MPCGATMSGRARRSRGRRAPRAGRRRRRPRRPQRRSPAEVRDARGGGDHAVGRERVEHVSVARRGARLELPAPVGLVAERVLERLCLVRRRRLGRRLARHHGGGRRRRDVVAAADGDRRALATRGEQRSSTTRQHARRDQDDDAADQRPSTLPPVRITPGRAPMTRPSSRAASAVAPLGSSLSAELESRRHRGADLVVR